MTVDRRVSVVAPAVTSVPLPPPPTGTGVGCRILLVNPAASNRGQFVVIPGGWYRALLEWVNYTTPFLQPVWSTSYGYSGIKTLIPGVFFYHARFRVGWARGFGDPWPWSSRAGGGWTVSVSIGTSPHALGSSYQGSYAATDYWGNGTAECDLSGFVALPANEALTVTLLTDFPGGALGVVDMMLVSG